MAKESGAGKRGDCREMSGKPFCKARRNCSGIARTRREPMKHLSLFMDMQTASLSLHN